MIEESYIFILLLFGCNRVVQSEEQSRRVQDYMHEANKAFARHADDEDLERMLKGQERDGDPMLEFIRQKKMEQDPDRELYWAQYFIMIFMLWLNMYTSMSLSPYTNWTYISEEKHGHKHVT